MGEDRGANPLLAGRHRRRRRKPPGPSPKVFFCGREGFPKALSPVPNGIGLFYSRGDTGLLWRRRGPRGSRQDGRVPLPGRGPSKLGELLRADRLTQGIGHCVGSTANESNHAEGVNRKPMNRPRTKRQQPRQKRGHVCPHMRREGTGVSTRGKLSLNENGQRF